MLITSFAIVIRSFLKVQICHIQTSPSQKQKESISTLGIIFLKREKISKKLPQRATLMSQQPELGHVPGGREIELSSLTGINWNFPLNGGAGSPSRGLVRV